MSDSAPTLAVIIGSTRPTRAGEAVARWFDARARGHGGFAVELVDLAQVNLPLLDEPHQAVKRMYEHEHTRRWSETVSRADAFAFVTPEYNHGVNGATKNAIDYLYHEWRHKPFAIVSYGGASRGLRAAQALTLSLVSLNMAPAGVLSISLATHPVTDGLFAGDDALAASAASTLDEMKRLATALRPLRD